MDLLNKIGFGLAAIGVYAMSVVGCSGANPQLVENDYFGAVRGNPAILNVRQEEPFCKLNTYNMNNGIQIELISNDCEEGVDEMNFGFMGNVMPFSLDRYALKKANRTNEVNELMEEGKALMKSGVPYNWQQDIDNILNMLSPSDE